MRRIAMVAGIVLGAMLTGNSVGVAEATAGNPASLFINGASPRLDECQECEWRIERYEGGNQSYVAMWDHYASDGHCYSSILDCVRCEDSNCDYVWDSGIFSSYGAAEQWLEFESDCGDCNDEGGGVGMQAAAATEMQDAVTLARLVAASDGSVWLNQERAAIQGWGCAGAGKVGLHIAVDAALLVAVRAELALLNAVSEARN